MLKAYGMCKLCLEYKFFAKSHIIQKALYKDPFNKTSKIGFLYSEETKKKITYKNGIFGCFLCLECENKFNLWDDKGFKLLFEEHHRIIEVPDPKLTDKSIILSEVSKGEKYNNKELLKMFLISILWRASVSGREEFSLVKLGDKFEQKARLAIINKESTYFPEFDACISKFEDGLAGFMLPIKQKYDYGINGYTLDLPYFSCLIKIDKRPFPAELRGLSLNTASSVIILHRSWKESEQRKTLIRVLHKIGA